MVPGAAPRSMMTSMGRPNCLTGQCLSSRQQDCKHTRPCVPARRRADALVKRLPLAVAEQGSGEWTSCELALNGNIGDSRTHPSPKMSLTAPVAVHGLSHRAVFRGPDVGRLERVACEIHLIVRHPRTDWARLEAIMRRTDSICLVEALAYWNLTVESTNAPNMVSIRDSCTTRTREENVILGQRADDWNL